MPEDYVIPKGFAAFFHNNDAEIGVYRKRMMAWVKDFPRWGEMAAHACHMDCLQSIDYYYGGSGDDYDYAMMDESRRYREEMDKIFIHNFCAPKGTPEFFGVSMPEECDGVCSCKRPNAEFNMDHIK